VGELGLDLVVEAQGAGLDRLVVLQAERQQHGLLDPLVHRPLADGLARGDAQVPVVEFGDHVLDGLAHLGRRLGGGEVGTVVPCGVDGLLELLGHWKTLK